MKRAMYHAGERDIRCRTVSQRIHPRVRPEAGFQWGGRLPKAQSLH